MAITKDELPLGICESSLPRTFLPRKLQFNEKEHVTIKEKFPQWNYKGEEAEKIPNEEAICRFCFNIFREDNVLKMKCECGFITLAHESCAVEWSQKKGNNKCDICEQDIQYIPVSLTRNHLPSDPNKMEHTGNSTCNIL